MNRLKKILAIIDLAAVAALLIWAFMQGRQRVGGPGKRAAYQGKLVRSDSKLLGRLRFVWSRSNKKMFHGGSS